MQNTFEASIYSWSLRFIDAETEAHYLKERRALKRMPRALAIFFGLTMAAAVVLYVLDIMMGFFFDPKYGSQYATNIYSILAYAAFIPILAIEYLFFKCECLARARGTLLATILYLILFYSSLSYYIKYIDYPAFGGG